MACLKPGPRRSAGENCCHWDPRRGRLRATLGATPEGYTGKSGRAERPYFTGLSRSHFKVAEREGFSPPFRRPPINQKPRTYSLKTAKHRRTTEAPPLNYVVAAATV